MDLRYSREITVGTVVIVAVLIFVFGTMWLSGQDFRHGNEVRIRFADASGLKSASPVRVSGVQVGKVEEIVFQGVGNVLVTISLPDKIQPRTDANATIESVSLVGDYAVIFNPGKAPQPLPDTAIIQGHQAVGLADRAAVLAGRADTLMANLQTIINQRTADDLHEMLQSLQRLSSTMADRLPATTTQATQTMAALQHLSARLDSVLASPTLGATMRRIDTLTSNTSAMTAQLAVTSARLDTLLAGVTHGEGTLGKLAADSTLYHNLVGMTAQLDSLVAELRKNPGKIQLNVPVQVF